MAETRQEHPPRMAKYMLDLAFNGTAQAFRLVAMPAEVMVNSDSDWAVCREIRSTCGTVSH